jgi:FkbM family methyltransferase
MNGRWMLTLPEHRQRQWEHEWEAERLDSMHAVLGPGDVMYDCGAEEGDLPALWASWGASVVLIEPGRRVWANMKAIWDANNLPAPLATFPGFAADTERQPEDAEGLTVGGWPACADGPVIDNHGFANVWERPDIAATTIDSLTQLITPPTAITVDVEGAELRVMRGAEQTLRTHRPIVWISVHPQFMLDTLGDRASDLYRFMAELGYTVTTLAEDHENHVMFAHPDGRHP